MLWLALKPKTVALTGAGERMRASGPVQREVRPSRPSWSGFRHLPRPPEASAIAAQRHWVCEKSKALSRLFAAASRLPRGDSCQRVSMNLRIDTVS